MELSQENQLRKGIQTEKLKRGSGEPQENAEATYCKKEMRSKRAKGKKRRK